jgi:hypothetical protein
LKGINGDILESVDVSGDMVQQLLKSVKAGGGGRVGDVDLEDRNEEDREWN